MRSRAAPRATLTLTALLVAAAAGMNSPTWPVKTESARIVIYGLP